MVLDASIIGCLHWQKHRGKIQWKQPAPFAIAKGEPPEACAGLNFVSAITNIWG